MHLSFEGKKRNWNEWRHIREIKYTSTEIIICNPFQEGNEVLKANHFMILLIVENRLVMIVLVQLINLIS